MSTTPARHSNTAPTKAFIFGIVILIGIIYVAIAYPEPTQFSYTIFRISIALAAAGIAAVFPGFLDIKFKSWLRAGGALAVFVVVYFFSPAPPSTIDPKSTKDPETKYQQVADIWLSVMDSGDYAKAFQQTSESFKGKFTEAQFTQLAALARGKLGRMQDRKLYSITPLLDPPGSAPGAYRSIIYKTQFSALEFAIYEQANLLAEGNDWKVVGYFIAKRNELGQFVPFEP